MWRVPLPLHAAERWLTAHQPRGLPPDGMASGGTLSGGTDMIGHSYRGPARAAWQSADLEIGVAKANHGGSVIRADAVIVWLDPRPVRYGPGAHPVRVSLAGGCPRSDRGVTGVINPGGALSQRLLPAGSPKAGLVCRYDGVNGRPFRLRTGQRLDALAARRLARSMARLPLSHVDGGSWHCAMDDGSAEVVVLVYPGHPDVDLWVTLSGCGLVSNGHIATGIAAWLRAST
jgi:hypothetical protein